MLANRPSSEVDMPITRAVTPRRDDRTPPEVRLEQHKRSLVRRPGAGWLIEQRLIAKLGRREYGALRDKLARLTVTS